MYLYRSGTYKEIDMNDVMAKLEVNQWEALERNLRARKARQESALKDTTLQWEVANTALAAARGKVAQAELPLVVNKKQFMWYREMMDELTPLFEKYSNNGRIMVAVIVPCDCSEKDCNGQLLLRAEFEQRLHS